MVLERVRTPGDAGEREQLTGWLDLQRAVALWKAEGLSDADAHRALIPSSPLMTVAGIISHLRWTEHLWFRVMFLGEPADSPPFTAEDGDMRVEGVPLAELVEAYVRQCADSDAIIAAHDLDQPGRHPDFEKARSTLRWMLHHMVEETARHAGHLDLIRELLDGRTGYY
ncbi:DinB family protein [Euzebya sp.]|uniref:DinB family protein n=1 Tax=Euzebya sp. TaxID=1971409 RepID=UPI0035156117